MVYQVNKKNKKKLDSYCISFVALGVMRKGKKMVFKKIKNPEPIVVNGVKIIPDEEFEVIVSKDDWDVDVDEKGPFIVKGILSWFINSSGNLSGILSKKSEDKSDASSDVLGVLGSLKKSEEPAESLNMDEENIPEEIFENIHSAIENITNLSEEAEKKEKEGIPKLVEKAVEWSKQNQKDRFKRKMS